MRICVSKLYLIWFESGLDSDEMLKLQPLQWTQLSAKVNKCRLCIDRYSSACLKRKYYYLTPKGRCPFVTMNNAKHHLDRFKKENKNIYALHMTFVKEDGGYILRRAHHRECCDKINHVCWRGKINTPKRLDDKIAPIWWSEKLGQAEDKRVPLRGMNKYV